MVLGHCLFFLSQININVCGENNNSRIVIIVIIYLNLSEPAALPPARFDRSWRDTHCPWWCRICKHPLGLFFPCISSLSLPGKKNPTGSVGTGHVLQPLQV